MCEALESIFVGSGRGEPVVLILVCIEGPPALGAGLSGQACLKPWVPGLFPHGQDQGEARKLGVPHLRKCWLSGPASAPRPRA